ncbi:hypothetical protein MKX62_21415 [Sporosarcina sp. FSL K6-5500]
MDLEKTVVNGVWEGNIGRVNRGTVQVFTGKRLSGTELTNFYTSGGIDDTRLKVFGEDGLIYITYETLEIKEATNDTPTPSTPIASVPTKVFVDEKNIEKILDRMYELELKQGPKGKDGYTPVKGVDYFDGEKGNTGTSEWDEITNKPTVFPPSVHQHDASAINVVDASNRFVGTNVETVLNELFTNADNAQKGVATVVGPPATQSDTLTQLITHIQNSKNALATPLGMGNTATLSSFASTLVTQRNSVATAINAKGVSASSADTLASLVTKIGQISTGKKSASGTLIKPKDGFVVTGLGFSPEYVIVYSESSTLDQGNAGFISVIVANSSLFWRNNLIFGVNTLERNNYSYQISPFSSNLTGAGYFIISGGYSEYFNLKWVAFG